jgi:hypothetical protein
MPATAKRTTAINPAHHAEKTAFAVLTVIEKAGKEITQIAREGKKRVVAHERKGARARPKARKA